jgi:midasin
MCFLIIDSYIFRLVYNETASINMRALALAVCQGHPILLEGVGGAGKTALVDELARLTENTSIYLR